jgi:hypothetical protein
MTDLTKSQLRRTTFAVWFGLIIVVALFAFAFALNEYRVERAKEDAEKTGKLTAAEVRRTLDTKLKENAVRINRDLDKKFKAQRKELENR